MALYCEIDDLVTESDVEQKFIYRFLSSSIPMGLGLNDSEIFTKLVLRQRLVGKGQKQKFYYPDYLVMIRGIPMLVVEAKKPEEALDSGYAEARLYAQEVNASFPHKINVCQFIIACNGNMLWAGYSDQAEPEICLSYSDFAVENIKFVSLIETFSRPKLAKLSDKPYMDTRGNAYFATPVSKLGGNRVQNEELVENSFGRTLIFENRAIFDPETEHDRTIIVQNAYITSAKRDQHAEPMYKEIRRFELPSRQNTIALATDNPSEFIGKLSEKLIGNHDAYSLMLLIGNVGSGKTTFTRYFKQVYLAKNHPDLYAKCEWIFVNMNFAPLSKDEIYTWLKHRLIEGIISEHSDIDFDNYEIIKRVFRRDIARFDKGLGSLLRESQAEYIKELYSLLTSARNEPESYLESLLFYIKENFSHIPIVVLDNCDKRNKDEQLLMFDVAQWLRNQYKCIVILPMRDSTYDAYKFEPPLDTVVRDLVFRIDPPDLLKVLQSRLDYITRITDQAGDTYVLQNGIQVAIKRSELADYFRLIMVAIRKDRWISNIFYRLSDRNTRNGIQMFEDFCKSGHMNSSDIFAMRVLGEAAEIPTYKFMNVLLRKNRRFYSGDASNFVNLFSSDYLDDFPDPFVRADILHWLKSKSEVDGLGKSDGMFSASSLIKELQLFGHKGEVVLREVQYLIKKGLIFCESLSDSVSDNDLIKISLPGALHLKMLNNVQYLAACAEDTLFKNTTVMTRISRRLMTTEHCSRLVSALNARDLFEYLENYRKEYTMESLELIAHNDVSPFDLGQCRSIIDQWITSNPILAETVSRIDKYSEGSIVYAKVVSKNAGSLVCIIGEDDVKGFLTTTKSRYELQYPIYSKVAIGDILSCEVLEYDSDHNSFQLKYVEYMTDQHVVGMQDLSV